MLATPSTSSLRLSVAMLLLTTLLLQPTAQTCGEGCLSCGQSKDTGEISCQVCDLFNFYLKSFDGSCEKKEVENCEIGSLDHFTTPCLLCKPNYVLDIVQGKCVSVNVSKVVQDCHRYSSISTCLSCVSGHYMSYGQCIKSETEVQDCLYYSDEGICSQCMTDKYLDRDSNQCLGFPQAVGCSVYNSLRCDQCKYGFAQDLNFYMRRSATMSEAQSFALGITDQSQVSGSLDNNCFPLNVPNCKVHETADSCMECDSGYFVTDDRKCQAYPDNRIQNCRVYSNLTTCYECDDLYKLDGNACVRRTLIDNCAEYHRTGDTCTKCEDGYWTSGTACSSLTMVDFCKTYQTGSDNCQLCEDTHILDSNDTCLERVDHCKTFGLTHGTADHNQCTECEDDYFLLNNTAARECIQKQHQPFCKVPEDYKNECMTCASGYYNDNGFCKPYTVDFCEEPETDKDECMTCIEGFEKVNGVCGPIELNNCKVPHNIAGQCDTCVDGFYKDSSNICRMRNLVGCETPTADKNECTTCAPGYERDSSDNLCYIENEPNCAAGGFTKGKCTTCATGYELTEFGTCYMTPIDLANCANNNTITCNVCDDSNTHFMEPITKYCKPRTNTNNCVTYDTYADLCTSCTSGNYLHGGTCETTTVTCDSTVPGRNECATCPDNFYLDPVSKMCLKNFKENCKAANAGDDTFGCNDCETGYYLNPETRLCEKGYLPHCATYTDSTTCTTCETGSYLLNGRCYKNFNLGCETPATTPTAASQCTACFPGFVLVSGICKLASVSNCLEYDATTGNCTTCIDGWYLDSNVCKKKYVAHCLVYTASTSVAECDTCKSMYHGTACARITAINCVESDGQNDACSICSPGYKINSTTCSEITKKNFRDPHCKGNDTTDDKPCTVCNDNFSLMYFDEIFFKAPKGCVQKNSDDPYKCYQCGEGYELTTELLCNPVDTNTVCLKATSNFTGGLANTFSVSKCDVCRNTETHYFDNGQCKERKTAYGCEIFKTSNDECETCQAPLNLKETSISRISCKDVTGSTPIMNCAVYDQVSTSPLTCKYCEIGYKLDTTCLPYILDFPENGPAGDLSGFNTSSFETNFLSVVPAFKSGSVISLGAKVAKVGVFPKIVHDNEIHSIYNQINGTYEIGSINPNAALTSTPGGGTSWFNSNDIAECAISAINSSTIYCLACSNGKLGRTSTSLHDSTSVIDSCVDAAPLGIQKKYTGMGYVQDTVVLNTQTNMDGVGEKMFVAFDSCTGNRTLVVYLLKSAGDLSFKLPYAYSNINEPYQCVDQIHEQNQVENCQVYGYAGTVSASTPDLSTTYESLGACLSCKPGYYGVSAGSGDLEFLYKACLPIENCDLLSSDNTMMNACKKCKPGYAWDVETTNYKIRMHKCVKASDYCVVYNSESEQCRICEAGYNLNDKNTCTKIDDLDCTTQGIQMPDFLDLNIASENDSDKIFGYMTHFYLAREISNNSKTMFCEVCKGNSVPVIDTTANGHEYCVYDSTKNIEGCLKYQAESTNSKCSECAEGYVLNQTSGECTNADLFEGAENCTEYLSTTSNLPRCQKCKEGFSIHEKTSHCTYNPMCTKKTTNPEKCTACQRGYYLDPNDRMCYKTSEDSECAELFMDNAGGANRFFCVTCKDKSKIPVHYDIRITGEQDHFKCVPDVYDFPFAMQPFLVQQEFNWGDEQDQFNFFDENGNKLLIFVTPDDEYGQNYLCVPRFGKQLFCDTFNEATQECTKCYNGYYLHDGQCYKGQIPLCVEYADTPTADYYKKQTCSKCESTAFIATVSDKIDPDLTYTNKCSPYTKDCDTFEPASDNCISCHPYYYLEVTDGPPVTTDCIAYTVVNCQVFMPNDNKCLICSSGYYMDSSNVCQPITISNCAQFSYNADECTLCDEGFYLTFEGKCTPNSVWNCEVYSQNKDECELCSSGHYLSEDGRCMQNFLQGCQVPKSNQNKCSLCKQGYYMDIAESLCKPHTMYHCSVFDQLDNKCVSCDSSSYMDTNNMCVEYSTALNCDTFHPKEDKCVNCLEGFYLNSDNKCLRYSMNTCRSYNRNKDECTSCHTSFYLDDNTKLCQPITSKNCAEFSVSSNRCSLCMDSHYLDLTSGDCLFYTVQNCAQYHPYKNQCATCKEGHYIDSNRNCHEHTASGCSSYSVNSDSCVSCQTGFYLNIASKKCLRYTATNCVSYRLQDDKCASCLPGFYLSNGVCKWYTVSNCSKNDSSADRCLGCIPGYYFFGGKCLPHTVKNCKEFDHESNKCVSCLPNHFFEYGHCFEYTAMYCKTFNPNKDLCVDCDNSSGMIFMNSDNDFCEKVSMVEHCETYHDDKDECQACMEGYFLENNMCHMNPTGIPNCEEYMEEDVCYKCEAGFYLSNNSCMPPNDIHECNRYSSADCCEQCNTDFALTSDFKCQATVHGGCATYADAENCATCSGNKVLEQNAQNHTVCVSSGISYCSEAVKLSSGVICTKCDTGYFTNDDQTQCLWPETLVEHCQDYSDHGVCSRCVDNYLLSKNNDKCTSDIATVGANCMVGHISDKPKCSRCAGGYYFDDTGVCQKCSENIDGCALCDITNLSRCLICSPGYYMKDDFSCEQYPPEPEIPIGVGITKMLVLALMSLLLIK